ncbi:MAG: ABC transporter ATP-binding protein [Nanobdellota archaeon]
MTLDAVSKRYALGTEALMDVNLSLTPEMVYGLIGHNGAGKTTLLSLCAGLVRPSSGTVTQGGRVGFLPQDETLPGHMRADELLRFFGKIKGEDPWVLMRALSIDSLFHSRITHLSHGMRKMVGICIAFLGNPDVILLDEPFSGLDPGMISQVKELIRGRKAAYIISSHTLTELESVCTDMGILKDGQLTYSGPLTMPTCLEVGYKTMPEKTLAALHKISGITVVKRRTILQIRSNREVFAAVVRVLLAHKVKIRYIRRLDIL